MSQLTCPKPYNVLTILVCIAAGVIGGLFGVVYGITGIVVASIGGVLAGIVWSHMMLQRIREGAMGAMLVGKGVFWGIAVGVADTLLLHIVGIIVAILTLPPPKDTTTVLAGGLGVFLSFGIISGIIAGAFNGLVCGLVWDAVAKKYPLTTSSQE